MPTPLASKTNSLMKISRLLLVYSLLAIGTLYYQQAFAQENESANDTAVQSDSELATDTVSESSTTSVTVGGVVNPALPQSDAISPDDTPKEVALTQLQLLVTNIRDRRETIAKLREQIRNSTIDIQTASLKEDLLEEQNKLLEQRQLLEQIATGSADLSLFDKPKQSKFSWQDEVQEVIKPVLAELKKITEKPRQLEKLRSERDDLTTRLQAANHAIKEIERVLDANPSADLKEYLSKLLQDWKDRRDNYTNTLKLVQYQLDARENTGQSKSELIVSALKDFITGRGLNLLLAISAFVFSFIAIRFVGFHIANAVGKDPDKERRLASRLLHVVFQVLTVLFSLFIMMATLYALGDWLILTLLLIMMVGLVFTLRTSLPRYTEEVRFLLNMGSAREGERVIYRDVPYKISRLNLRSDLINPLLRGGHIQLPMSEMIPLVSRRWASTEPWFPSRMGEYVILSDDTYGEVLIQTPEIVEIQVPGGDKKMYNIQDYLNRAPQNLSAGFGVYVTFGLDYALQDKITQEIPATLQEYLEKQFAQEKWQQQIKSIRVEFKEAGASSLDLYIMLDIDGEAAKYYLAIKRRVQTNIVDACNENNWTIPFNQLTVHMAQE